MRNINKVIVHCSFTPADMDIGASEIKMWHTEPPRNWSDNGYHYVIRRDGTIERGRPVERSGAHCAGHNRNSIGICLVGGARRTETSSLEDEMNFTLSQYVSLKVLHNQLDHSFGVEPDAWFGHHTFTEKKNCPNFDVQAFIDDGTIMEYTR